MRREKANLTVQGGGQRAGKLAQELSARNSLTIIVSVCQGHPNNNQITHHTAPIISLRTLPGVCSNGVWSLIKFALGAFRGRFYNSREEKKEKDPCSPYKLYLTTTDFLPGGMKTLLVGTSIVD
jgi:hypothetical protein